MKIEYFPESHGEASVVQLYGREPDRVAELREVVWQLAHGSVSRLAVHAMSGFEAVGGCGLFLSIGPVDLGLHLVSAPCSFECTLRRPSWSLVEGLLEPFCVPMARSSHQWLTDFAESSVGLCIATDRGW